ncbi:glutaredoxin family protein [Brachybacterium sp. EF45031]|uniref:glutaredoxin family protein n=1 Tax=Brachybacterium sillae TaxID=2810536 RepID=UPI00217E7E77|nr:glutaredoxin family protein [Brachybacterium sillae]MCS6711316.1 glutaredoxin family protein [Brachybacterium sillae]
MSSLPRPQDPDARVLVLSRDGCHLCEEALPTVRAEADRAGTRVEVVDIDTDPALRERFTYDVPVVIVDGRLLARYRVEAEALRGALRRPRWLARLRR